MGTKPFRFDGTKYYLTSVKEKEGGEEKKVKPRRQEVGNSWKVGVEAVERTE